MICSLRDTAIVQTKDSEKPNREFLFLLEK